MAKKKDDSDKINEMITWSKKNIGVPYAFKNGKLVNGVLSKSVGIDCTRFVRRCYEHIGIKLPKGWPGPMYRATKGKKFKVSKNVAGLAKLRAGDIVYFVENNGHGKKGHAALYIGDGKIIHSSTHKYGKGKDGVQIQKLFVGKGAYRSSKPAFGARVLSGGSATGYADSESGVTKYLKEAKKHVGKNGKAWVKKHAPSFHEGAWCADTQCALAKVTKMAGKVMPSNQSMAGGFGKSVVKDYGGKYIKGPGYGGGAVTPKPGDFIETYGGGCSKDNKYSAGHIGVVEYVKNGIVHTIEGNTSDSYARRQYNKGDKKVLWYARPDWDKVGGYDSPDDDKDDMFQGGLLYDSLSTKADATLREVCYANEAGEPTTDEKSPYRLCVANYTSTLFWITFAFGSGGEDDDDGGDEGDGSYKFPKSMNKNQRYVFNFLIEKGLNKAAACGILGNIRQENPACKPGHGTHHIGICQWSYSRYGNTEHTIEAECNLMWKELKGGYKSTLNHLKSVKNNTEGCKSAADYFCRHFEVCGNYSVEVPKRQNFALEFYNKIKLDSSSSGSGDGKTVGNWMVPVKASYMVNAYGEYGARRSYDTHAGIDMASPLGTPIYAANGGKVILARMYGGYGNCVRIKHDGGLVSLYGHGSKILVKEGQKVSKGDKILLMGSTGWSTGSHLHFQINKGTGTDYKSSVNPRKYCKIHGIGTGK